MTLRIPIDDDGRPKPRNPELAKLAASLSGSLRPSEQPQGLIGDPNAIPEDPIQRVLRVPIPLDAKTGLPCYPREWLEPTYRAELKAAHERKIRENMVRRQEILDLCEADHEARAEVMALCAKDAVFWINTFVWSIDPRERRKVAAEPLVLYEEQELEVRFFQDEFLASDEMLWIDEKSRAWGWTWLSCVAEPLWGWLYQPNFSCLLGSALEKDVDEGGMASSHESIFGKIRFVLNRLPEWMVPGDVTTNAKYNKNLSIRHPFNSNVLDGRQFCANWGRSTRYTMTASDEGAWSLNFRAAAMSFGHTSNRNHVGSTPKGLDNEYGMMVEAAKRGDSDAKIHTLWWGTNPNLTVDTYWKWRKTHGPTKTAQERDIDYGRSAGGNILVNFNAREAVIVARTEQRNAEGKVVVEAREALDYDPTLPLYLLADPGWDDAFALVWIQVDRVALQYRIVDFYQTTGHDALFLLPFILGYIPDVIRHNGRPWAEKYEYDFEELKIIQRHREWKLPVEIFGDRYGGSTATAMAIGETLYDVWEAYGSPPVTQVKVNPNEKLPLVQKLIDTLERWVIAGRLLTQRPRRDQPTIVECFQNYSWVERESPSGREMRRAPKHDKFCHAMDACQLFLVYEDPTQGTAENLAPTDLRPARGSGRGLFMRQTEHPEGAPPVYPASEPEDDDPITRG